MAGKIFSSHLPKPVKAGDFVFSSVDLMMTNDASITTVWEALRKIPGSRVRDPQKLAVILDHYCPSPSQEVSRIHLEIKAFAEKYGCPLYGQAEGVCYQLIPEKGHVLPGN